MTARRMHPAGIAVLAVAALRGAALPVVVALVATLGGDGAAEALARALAYAGIGVVGAGIVGYLTWRTKTYAVTDRAISSRRGVFSVRETVVPLERVQAIDTVQGPLQRLFGVTALHVQAAGGGREGEIVLEALSAGAVEELRAALGPAAPAPAAPVTTRRLSGRELAAAAVTAGQLGVILPVLAGASQVVDDVIGDDPAQAAGRFSLLPDTAGEVALIAAGLLLVAWLLSIAGAVVAFAGFTVTRHEDRLLIRRGLLARREASVPLARIQAVTVVEGLLRQPFGLASLRVEVAGYAAEAAAAQTLFPLLRVADVERFLATMAPGLAGAAASDGTLERPPRRARRRYVLPPVLVAAVPAAAASALVPGAGAWPLLALLPAAALGLATFRAAGWRLEPERVSVRSRRLARRTVLVPRRRLQQHAIEQNPFQRHAALASFSLAAGAGTRARVAHVEERAARTLFAAL